MKDRGRVRIAGVQARAAGSDVAGRSVRGVPRIPVVLGGCGTGRTSLLLRLRERLAADRRSTSTSSFATTPERFLAAVHVGVAVPGHGGEPARRCRARGVRRPARVLRSRTRAGGARHVPARRSARASDVRKLSGLGTCCASYRRAGGEPGNRFVLTTRYTTRTHRLLRDATARFEVVHVAPPRSRSADVLGRLRRDERWPPTMRTSRPSTSACAHRRPRGLRAGARRAGDATTAAAADPSSALTALSAPTGRLHAGAATATSSGCIAPAATARSRPSSTSSPKRAAHADRDLTPSAPHARLDEGLPVVARGRRSRHVPRQALQLRRSAAARLRAAVLPADAARATKTRAGRCSVRARPAAACEDVPPSRRAATRGDAPAGGSSRSTESGRLLRFSGPSAFQRCFAACLLRFLLRSPGRRGRRPRRRRPPRRRTACGDRGLRRRQPVLRQPQTVAPAAAPAAPTSSRR